MNECGVVNTDCYDTGNRLIEGKCTNARLGIIIDIVDWDSPGQQALRLHRRHDATSHVPNCRASCPKGQQFWINLSPGTKCPGTTFAS